MGQRKMPHTQVHAGKRVAVTLRNGQIIEGRFIKRAKNNRWIELWVAYPPPCQRGERVERIDKAQIIAFSPIKGELDLKKLGRKA